METSKYKIILISWQHYKLEFEFDESRKINMEIIDLFVAPIWSFKVKYNK